jgi:hypothetical protein
MDEIKETSDSLSLSEENSEDYIENMPSND